VDVAGQVLGNLKPPVDPIPGDNVFLTIDTRLQQGRRFDPETGIDYWNNVYNQYYRISAVLSSR